MIKKIWLLGLSIFAFSCSVDREEVPEEDLLVLDMITSVDGCTVHQYDLGETGRVEVRNFHDHLVIRVSMLGSSSLSQINFHFAENEERFPTNKKGKFLLGQMDYKNKYPQGTFYEEFRIPLSDVPREFMMVVYAEFGSGKNKSSAWAGGLSLNEADWSYFEYKVSDFPFYTGADQIREIAISEARAVESWDEVRKIYANMMDEGVDKSQWYAYNPSIDEIIDDFNDPSRETQLGDYSTTYTLGSGECSDSVNLTLRIVAD